MCRPIEFLLVEDNPGDIRLTQEFFKEFKLANAMSIVADAFQTLSFLRREGDYAEVSRPDIILCSFPLYWKHVAEIWGDIRRDASMRDIPIVLLTGFEGEEAALSDLSAIACCIAKPLNFERIMTLLHQISDLGVLVLTTRGRSANIGTPALA